MRVRDSSGPLRAQAIAGTYVVVLGFDHDRAAMDGVLGFAVERFDHTEGRHRWLDNRLRFPEARHRWGSNWNPFQTFAWGDYRAKPGHTYTYRVHTMTGEPGEELTPVSTVELRVRTEEPGVHGVWFNRGVYASQAYAERFKNRHPRDVPNREAWRWLSRGLEEALLGFIGTAVGDRQQLRGAFYEFEYLPVLQAFRVAADTGADVRLVVYDHPDNRDAVAAAGIDDLVVTWRAKAQIPHNKFVVAARDGVPRAVWTGSTNITENGIFGQSNVGHTVTDPSIAERYADYWTQLLPDPTPGTLNNWVDEHDPLPDPWPEGISVVFSPHTRTTAQDRYAELFGSAQELVCVTFPFKFDPRFAGLLPGDHTALRWLLFEDAHVADAHRELVTDPDTELVACGLVEEGGMAGWAAEHDNPFSHNIEYLHTKYLLADPLGDDPVVVTGSANFSNPSANKNDENMLVIRGDHGLAETYFTEFHRLFNHHRFRDALRLAAHQPTPGPETGVDAPVPLTPARWWDKYYDEPARDHQRRLLAGVL
ncbi:phospholipase D-like domain-containing protein [Streptomyces sp. NPDC047072]|uniref:phospholipase D-like domain-containing protein n=1 Tax=Streptomyces sp. NPDC047072 TaxID=3154809 RepID=UPI0033C6D15E